jgi:uncharacterized protein
VALFLVRYRYIDDVEAVAKLRPTHRAWLSTVGPSLVGSGPTADNGAALVFEADDGDQVGTLLDADPFAAAGVIAEREIVEWTLVRGRWAEAG